MVCVVRVRRAVLLAAALMLVATSLHGQPPRPQTRIERQIDLGTLNAPEVAIATRDRTRPATADHTVTLTPGDYVIARRPGAPAVEVQPAVDREARAWVLGDEFHGVGTDGRQIHFRPVIESVGGFHFTGGVFSSVIYVGLQDVADPAARYDLPRAINMLVSAGADAVSPPQLTVAHTSLPFTAITISARDPGESLQIFVQAAGAAERASVRVPVVRPRLEVVPSCPALQGLGLETCAVTIRSIGLDNPAGRTVVVGSTSGSFVQTPVTLDETGTATTTLRSSSVGSVTISASSPPLTPASAEIEFSWPVRFLVTALVGGAIGTWLRHSRQHTRGHRTRGWGADLSRGTLTGLVIVAAYAVGVNLLPVQPVATAGEALVFVVSALGAFWDLRLPTAAPQAPGAPQG